MNNEKRVHILSTLDILEQCIRSLRITVSMKDPSAEKTVRSMSPNPEIGDLYATIEEEKSIEELYDSIGKDFAIGELTNES